MAEKINKNPSIYETYIKKIARLLTKDFHLRKDLEQEMMMYLWVKKVYYNETLDKGELFIAKNRAINFLNKFHKGQIPFGDMNDLDRINNKQD
jgi:hypothetical protein